MTWLRTHFVIDMTAGVVMAFLILRFGEKFSYLCDVKIRGTRAEDRLLWMYKACPACGWANHDPNRQLISIEEKHAQASVYDPKGYQ